MPDESDAPLLPGGGGNEGNNGQPPSGSEIELWEYRNKLWDLAKAVNGYAGAYAVGIGLSAVGVRAIGAGSRASGAAWIANGEGQAFIISVFSEAATNANLAMDPMRTDYQTPAERGAGLDPRWFPALKPADQAFVSLMSASCQANKCRLEAMEKYKGAVAAGDQWWADLHAASVSHLLSEGRAISDMVRQHPCLAELPPDPYLLTYDVCRKGRDLELDPMMLEDMKRALPAEAGPIIDGFRSSAAAVRLFVRVNWERLISEACADA